MLRQYDNDESLNIKNSEEEGRPLLKAITWCLPTHSLIGYTIKTSYYYFHEKCPERESFDFFPPLWKIQKQKEDRKKGGKKEKTAPLNK